MEVQILDRKRKKQILAGKTGSKKTPDLEQQPLRTRPAIAAASATEIGFSDFAPNACLISRYEPGARLSFHQGTNRRDFSKPIVTASFGLPATLQFGGIRRSYPVRRFTLRYGDIAAWGGLSCLFYHGITAVEDDQHGRLGGMRISLMFREVR